MNQGDHALPEPQMGTQADLARRLGVNRSTIHRALAAGRLVAAADPSAAARGLLDLAASVSRYHATRGSRADLVDRHAERRGAAKPEQGAQAVTGGRDDGKKMSGQPLDGRAALKPADGVLSDETVPPSWLSLDRVAVKSAILAAENQQTAIEFALRRGKRLLLDDVGRESQGLGSRLQDHLHRVIDQLAARLAAVPDASERARLLLPELRRVDRAFVAGLVDSLRALKPKPLAPSMTDTDLD